jgi:hypothetical protein
MADHTEPIVTALEHMKIVRVSIALLSRLWTLIWFAVLVLSIFIVSIALSLRWCRSLTEDGSQLWE